MLCCGLFGVFPASADAPNQNEGQTDEPSRTRHNT
jgi:hypothetical protein